MFSNLDSFKRVRVFKGIFSQGFLGFLNIHQSKLSVFNTIYLG